MAFIAQPFRLTVLPKISSLNNYETQVSYLQVPNTLAPSSNKINIGISGSSISQYIINPVPKLIYNLPIPSTNVVTAYDVADLGFDQEIWCYALMANNKSYTINVISRYTSSDTSNIENSEENSKEKVKINHKIVSIKIFIMTKTIVIVLENGQIQIYNFQLKMLHSVDISYSNVKMVQHFNNEQGENYFFLLCGLESNKVCYKLLQLFDDPDTTLSLKELNSIILENLSFNIGKIFYQFGKVYILNKNIISIYSLPHFQLSGTIKLPFLNDDMSVVSFKPISTNRVLLTCDNTIYLLDVFYGAILFQKELTSVKFIQLLSTAVVNGIKGQDNKTFAIGVSTKHGSNPTSALDIIAIDVGSGMLKDTIGKGIMKNEPNKLHCLRPLFDDNDNDDKIKYCDFDWKSILEQFENCNQLNDFDLIFFNKLGLEHDYYTENDRYINNQEFLSKILEFIFQKFTKEYPRALTYLLTHPLFPISYTKGLLSKLKGHPRLFKQAIVTCPNLPLNELLYELFTIMNDELSLDLSLRILQDFPKDAIKQGIKQLSKLDTTNFIEFIINEFSDQITKNYFKPQLFQLLSLVVDSVGLLALEDKLLNKLSNFINMQLSITEKNIELLNLINNTNTKNRLVPPYRRTSSSVENPIPLYSVEYLEC